ISADSLDIWCVGSTGGSSNFTGKLFKARTGTLTGITHTGNEIPKQFSLSQNYPNPFNPSTKIKFSIPGALAAQTFLSVYDILGKEVTVLVNQQLSPGSYKAEWNAANYPSGIYFYKLVVGDPNGQANTNNGTGNFTDTK